MFSAVGLFVILLLAMLYVAFIRFRNPPGVNPQPTPVGMVAHPGHLASLDIPAHR